jgi:hypothetical protein
MKTCISPSIQSIRASDKRQIVRRTIAVRSDHPDWLTILPFSTFSGALTRWGDLRGRRLSLLYDQWSGCKRSRTDSTQAELVLGVYPCSIPERDDMYRTVIAKGSVTGVRALSWTKGLGSLCLPKSGNVVVLR